MQLNRIIIYAGDAIRCASFYRDHFQMKPLGEWSPEWAELDGGGCRLAFHQAYGAEGPITTPTGSGHHPHKIVFAVADVAAERQRLIEAGVSMGGIDVYEEGDVVLCQGTDPEGHVFQLCNH